MESVSNSIMSFSNDSTVQTTLKADYNNVNVHELALHAMRDRCLLLQKRINTLENDNMRLKLQASQSSSYIPLQDNEKQALEQKIAELTKQKSQLMHHVFMVSCENKNLWNKIASIKGADKQGKETKPLVRTNTYIQSTPRTSSNDQEKYSESSLEDISLKLINSYIQEKSQLVEQYEQMSQLQDLDDEKLLNVDSIGFTFMVEPTTDSLREIRNQIEKLNFMNKELEQQESDLKLILSRVEAAFADGYKCPSCITNNVRVVTSEHKEIETSDSLANWATPTDSANYNNNYSEVNTSAFKNIPESEKDLTEEPYDKICPMCGETFQKDVSFPEFQSHVENHFVGDIEPDSTIDNFENLPNSFDNIM